MGVKGLTALLARFAPACISMPAAKDIRGWTIAIDSNIFVQRFFRGASGKLEHAERHTTGMRNMAAYARSLDITPIFVFDGNERASGKEAEMQKRRELKSRIRDEHREEQLRARRIAAMEQVRASLLDCESSGILPLDPHRAEPLPRGQAHECDDVVETIIRGDPNRELAVAWLADNATRLAASQACLAKPSGRRLTVDARINALELAISRILLFRLGATTNEPDSVALDAQCSLQTLMQLSAERLATLGRRVESLTPAHIDECRRQLDSLGFATHKADGHVESEALCAALVRQGVADAACSEDLDVLAFGGQRLLRGFYTPADEMMLIDLDTALVELGLTRASFVDLCILCGTDFSATLEKVGPITALRLIRQYGSIEQILENNPEIRPRDGFQHRVARDVFLQDVRPPFTDRSQVAFRPDGQRAGLPFDPFAPGAHHPVLQ
ncbi:hypothetical protein H4S07_004853 [Coemansia furcata]|uniref:Uncharacterized protein n=1 Tax=Coemansia furcata TaxID=417177 RepID=A0ACC1L662_9FUNG|nr:hypothetical protein H4S07_004853 [Coemansia furcata]